MADRDLANYDAELAAKVHVMPGLDIRLTFIDTSAGEDKYHVLQGLKDPTVGGDPNCFYLYQRWGGTGTRGEIKVDGPMLQPSVALAAAQVFKDKTGAEWGSLKPGDRALPGKYWLQQQATPDLLAKWEYYVSDGVDGKRTGWYPFAASASEEVEELYAQHIANSRESRTATRLVSSGHFSYKVDLTKMTQRNTRTKKERTIRRADGNEEGSMDAPRCRAMKRKAMKKVKVMAKFMKMAPGKSATKKAMKVMKEKRKSKVGTKSQVLKGLKVKTRGGLLAADLMKNKSGKVVSAKMHAIGKKAYEKNIQKWMCACTKARNELGLVGFVAVKKGSAFYDRAKALMSD